MCSWERTVYACHCRSKPTRVPYSCSVYTRHIYGSCRYDSAHDQVHEVISYDYCEDCRKLYEYVNL
ncbi:hypothetical protein MMYC01_201229 [Madurella mycetomatis]|uniref:Uncharacterized protein n=1 Tax=Madurella mycetomatis TaxID=100816 RepID=A0A175WHV5_9PEZI|nr:hypothetical protein MMYC01_201229 [Madurella mycetomatis]